MSAKGENRWRYEVEDLGRGFAYGVKFFLSDFITSQATVQELAIAHYDKALNEVRLSVIDRGFQLDNEDDTLP